MKQYCRYCNHCCYGDFVYCSIKNDLMSEAKAKRLNNCKDFEFNEIDVFNFNNKYKARKRPKIENESLF